MATEIPGGAAKLGKAGERAGLRVRIDHKPPSCLVRLQDDEAQIGYVAQYISGKASSAYSWSLVDRRDGRVPFVRYGVRELTRRITLTRRLRAAQARL